MNAIILDKIFPLNIASISDKLFNKQVFLELFFIDLINAHSQILDMDISRKLILSQYKRY